MVICRVWSTLFYGLPKVEIILKPELSPSHSAADDRQLFAVLGRRGLTPKDGLTVYLRSEFSDRNTLLLYDECDHRSLSWRFSEKLSLLVHPLLECLTMDNANFERLILRKRRRPNA
jgi:hypothetical protein